MMFLKKNWILIGWLNSYDFFKTYNRPIKIVDINEYNDDRNGVENDILEALKKYFQVELKIRED